jgi:hypothetical protein
MLKKLFELALDDENLINCLKLLEICCGKYDKKKETTKNLCS